MRNILTISGKLVDLIPNNSDDKFLGLKHKIKKHVIESVPYADINMIESSWFWNKLSIYVNEAITKEDYDNIPWCKEFIDIFQDKISVT